MISLPRSVLALVALLLVLVAPEPGATQQKMDMARGILADLREADFEVRQVDEPSQQNGRPIERP